MKIASTPVYECVWSQNADYSELAPRAEHAKSLCDVKTSNRNRTGCQKYYPTFRNNASLYAVFGEKVELRDHSTARNNLRKYLKTRRKCAFSVIRGHDRSSYVTLLHVRCDGGIQ